MNKNEKYWPLASNTLTTSLLCDLFGIDDHYKDEEFVLKHNSVMNRYKTLLHYFGDAGVSFNSDGETLCQNDGVVMPIDELVGQAGLISIEIGMADIFNRSKDIAMRDLDLNDLNKEDLAKAAADLVKYLYEGFEYWKVNFPFLLDYIKETNPDCTVVIIGAYNPLYNLKISDELFLPIGTAVSAITSMMNSYYRLWANQRGYLYLDISNIETGIVEHDTNLMDVFNMSEIEMGVASHPTKNGHKQIARAFISLLKQGTKNNSKTDISVDMGRYSTVSSVYINGSPVTDYTFANSVLTVHVGNKLARSMTVISLVGDKTLVTQYQLSYFNGYTAYRVNTTNDVKKDITTTKNTIKKTVKSTIKTTIESITSLTEKIKNLFSK